MAKIIMFSYTKCMLINRPVSDLGHMVTSLSVELPRDAKTLICLLTQYVNLTSQAGVVMML